MKELFMIFIWGFYSMLSKLYQENIEMNLKDLLILLNKLKCFMKEVEKR